MYAIRTKAKGNRDGRFIYTHPLYSPYAQYAYSETESQGGSTLEPRRILTAGLEAGGAYAEQGQKYQFAPEGVQGNVKYLDGTAIGFKPLPGPPFYFTSAQYYGHNDGIAQPDEQQALAMRLHVEDTRRLDPRFDYIPGGAYADLQMGMRYETEQSDWLLLNQNLDTSVNAMEVAHSLQSYIPFVRESVPIRPIGNSDAPRAILETRLTNTLPPPRREGQAEMRERIRAGLY